MEKDRDTCNAILIKKDLDIILECIKSIEYGTVTLKIQNNKVVQIEKTEKYKTT